MNTTKNKASKPTTTTTRIAILPLGFQPIQDCCAMYRNGLTHLQSLSTKYNAALADLQAKFMPGFRNGGAAVALVRMNLTTLIDNSRPLFEKPKTRVFSDIKVGLQKQKGSTVVADEDKTIELIAKHFPERLDDLAPSKRKLSLAALNNMTAADLKKIAVEIEADTDAVIIKPQDSDIEKAVAALLKETEQPLANAA
jgi:hypothetical protein